MRLLTPSIAVAALLGTTFAARPAAADLPPPDGTKYVDFRFEVTGLPADTDRVLLAYPCGGSNGAPIVEYARLENGTPVSVGRRGGSCAIYNVAKPAFEAFAASWQPGASMGSDPALDALTAGGVACTGGPELSFSLPSSDPREVIEQRLIVDKLDATSCTLLTVAEKTSTPAPAQTGCRGCAAPGDPTGPLLVVAIFGGGALVTRRRRRSA